MRARNQGHASRVLRDLERRPDCSSLRADSLAPGVVSGADRVSDDGSEAAPNEVRGYGLHAEASRGTHRDTIFLRLTTLLSVRPSARRKQFRCGIRPNAPTVDVAQAAAP